MLDLTNHDHERRCESACHGATLNEAPTATFPAVRRVVILRGVQDLLIALLVALSGTMAIGADSPLEVASLDRTSPVDFEKEILPVFKRNCLACHGSVKPKGGLVLETPQTIAKGGDGGDVVKPGSAAESFLFQVAAHQVEDGVMPPKNNKVKAENLTPHELALLKLWIDQGATGEVRTARPVEWKTIPPSLNAIHTVAVTDDGQFAACARANRLFIYHVPSKQLVSELTDPTLTQEGLYPSEQSAAHRDFVQSLAFHPEGNLLASGGYRTIKLWRRIRGEPQQHLALAGTSDPGVMAITQDGRWLAIAQPGSPVQLWNTSEGKITRSLTDLLEHDVTALEFSEDGRYLAAGARTNGVVVWTVAEDRDPVRIATSRAVTALAWLAGRHHLAVGSEDATIEIWDLAGETEVAATRVREWSGHQGPVTVLRCLPTLPHQLISGGHDGRVCLWNVEDGQLIREMNHGAPITDVALRGDGKRLASAAGQPVVKLWNIENGQIVAELKGDRYAQEEVASRERHQSLAAAELGYRKSELERLEKEQKDRETRVAKAKEAFEPAEKLFAEKQKAQDERLAAKSEAERHLASLHAEIKRVTEAFEQGDQQAKEVQMEVKRRVEQAASAEAEAERARQAKLEAESFYADAQRVLERARVAVSLSGLSPEEKAAVEQRVADAETVSQKSKSLADTASAEASAKAELAEQAKALAGQTVDALATKAFAAGKLRVDFERITEGVDEKLKNATNQVAEAQKQLNDAEKEFRKAELEKSRAETEWQLAQKSEEEGKQTLAEARLSLEHAEAANQDSTAQLEAARQASVAAEKAMTTVAFSADQRCLITAGATGSIHTWDAEDGDAFEVYHWTGNPVRQLKVAADRGAVYAMTSGQAFSFDLRDRWILDGVLGSGDLHSPLEDRVTALAFSPDGRWLASGGGQPSRGGEIKIWDLKDRAVVHDWSEIHSDTVLSLEFSPDGRYLASGASDKFARVVDIASGEVVKTFEGHTHHVMGVAWKADGRTLATSGADHVIKVWDVVKGDRKKNIQGFDKEITAIQFVGVGDEVVVSSGDPRIRLIKEDGKTVRDFGGIQSFQHATAVTPSGSLVVGGGEDSVLRVWNGAKGDLVASFEPPNDGAAPPQE